MSVVRKVSAPAVLLALAALLLLGGGAEWAAAAEALFPAHPPATQVSRDVTLQQAAQAGAVKLGAKGGYTGDDVSLELEGKKFKGPILVTERLEFTPPEAWTPKEREALRAKLPTYAKQAETELNRISGKTSSGDRVNFKMEWKWREPTEPANPNFHQVAIINPLKDLAEPTKDFRSGTEDTGVPNKEGAGVAGTFGTNDLKPNILAHELLHFAGLDDRYTDTYEYKGRKYPLPENGMEGKVLKDYLAGHKPPLPPPPAGRVGADNTKGTSACDVMGTGAYAACRKISKRDLDFFGEQAGTKVTAQPGESLLNKNESDQNLGVGFTTIVFTAPGHTTVANGVSAYCLDHDRSIPIEGLFDVGPKVSELPDYEGVGKLLEYNAGLQGNLEDNPTGMQAAIWNLTAGAPLETSGVKDEAEALMASAGVAQNPALGVGLPAIADPNAGSPTTGAVSASGEVLPSTPEVETVETPQVVRLDVAEITPKHFRAGKKAFTDLVIAANGDVDHLDLAVQRKAGKSWKAAKTLPSRRLEPGTTVLQLGLGRLQAAKFRLLVSLSGPFGEPDTRILPFTANG